MHSTRCWKIAFWARKRWLGCERWWLLDRLYRVVSGIRRQADSAHNGSQKNRDLFAAHSGVLSLWAWADTDRHSQSDSLLSQPFSRLCLVSHFLSFHNHSCTDNLCSGWPKLINWLTLEPYSKQLIYCRAVLTFSDWSWRQSRDWVVLDTNKCTKIKHRKTLCAVSTLQSVKTVLRCFVKPCHLQITGSRVLWPKSRCFHKLSHHDPDTWGITHPGPEVTMAEPGQCFTAPAPTPESLSPPLLLTASTCTEGNHSTSEKY